MVAKSFYSGCSPCNVVFGWRWMKGAWVHMKRWKHHRKWRSRFSTHQASIFWVLSINKSFTFAMNSRIQWHWRLKASQVFSINNSFTYAMNCRIQWHWRLKVSLTFAMNCQIQWHWRLKASRVFARQVGTDKTDYCWNFVMIKHRSRLIVKGTCAAPNLHLEQNALSVVLICYNSVPRWFMVSSCHTTSNTLPFCVCIWIYCWLARTSHRTISRTVWLKVTPC